MNEMVERCARALCRAYGEDPDSLVSMGEWAALTAAPYPRWHHQIDAARSVIEEMREPTAAMVQVSNRQPVLEKAWRSMVDEALR